MGEQKARFQTPLHHEDVIPPNCHYTEKEILEIRVTAQKLPLCLIGAVASPGRKPVPKWYLSHFTPCGLVIPNTRKKVWLTALKSRLISRDLDHKSCASCQNHTAHQRAPCPLDDRHLQSHTPEPRNPQLSS